MNRVDGAGGAGDAVVERGGDASPVFAGGRGGHQRGARRGSSQEERSTAAAEHRSADCGGLGFLGWKIWNLLMKRFALGEDDVQIGNSLFSFSLLLPEKTC